MRLCHINRCRGDSLSKFQSPQTLATGGKMTHPASLTHNNFTTPRLVDERQFLAQEALPQLTLPRVRGAVLKLQIDTVEDSTVRTT